MLHCLSLGVSSARTLKLTDPLSIKSFWGCYLFSYTYFASFSVLSFDKLCFSFFGLIILASIFEVPEANLLCMPMYFSFSELTISFIFWVGCLLFKFEYKLLPFWSLGVFYCSFSGLFFDVWDRDSWGVWLCGVFGGEEWTGTLLDVLIWLLLLLLFFLSELVWDDFSCYLLDFSGVSTPLGLSIFFRSIWSIWCSIEGEICTIYCFWTFSILLF